MMTDYIKEFSNILRDIDYSRSTVTKFSDFLSLAAYSISQPFYNSEEIEEKYKNVAKNYSLPQLENFAHLIAIVTLALEEKMQDFLGQIFMNNDMGSAYKGQYFTPYHVSKLMSEMVGYNVRVDIKNKDILTLSEPCCGSGGMVIAFAEAMKDSGYNYQKHLFVEAIDIDDLCFKMTYIQLALLGIPAKVIKGNSITMEFQEVLYTPLFFINNLAKKLAERTDTQIVTETPEQISTKIGQLRLFE